MRIRKRVLAPHGDAGVHAVSPAQSVNSNRTLCVAILP